MAQVLARTQAGAVGIALCRLKTCAHAQQPSLRTCANPPDGDYRDNFEQIDEK